MYFEETAGELTYSSRADECFNDGGDGIDTTAGTGLNPNTDEEDFDGVDEDGDSRDYDDANENGQPDVGESGVNSAGYVYADGEDNNGDGFIDENIDEDVSDGGIITLYSDDTNEDTTISYYIMIIKIF